MGWSAWKLTTKKAQYRSWHGCKWGNGINWTHWWHQRNGDITLLPVVAFYVRRISSHVCHTKFFAEICAAKQIQCSSTKYHDGIIPRFVERYFRNFEQILLFKYIVNRKTYHSIVIAKSHYVFDDKNRKKLWGHSRFLENLFWPC